MGAACFTHPIDLVKVHLQTQKEDPGKRKLGMMQLAKRVVTYNGVTGLWNGLTASLFRQGTYSTARFAIYGAIQSRLACDVSSLTIGQKIGISAFAGCLSGLVATPGGIKKGLFSGGSICMARATVVTVGQVGLYDIFKTKLVLPFFVTDGLATHLTSSCLAGTAAAVLSQPLDVMKTRVLNAPVERNRVSAVFVDTLRTGGPLAFYKGLLPAWIRLLPQTVLTFLFFEQLRLRYGDVAPVCPS